MGIHDFLKRDRPPSAPAGNRPGESAEPRFGHYFMAHYALRMLALQQPIEVLAKLTSPNAYGILAVLLAEVAEVCRDDGCPPPDFTAADLHIHRRCVGRHACAVIRFPEPQASTEAHMAAIVVVDGPPAGARYFTLERAAHLRKGGERTVMSEWTKVARLNVGEGPAPAMHAFLTAIEERLRLTPSTTSAQ